MTFILTVDDCITLAKEWSSDMKLHENSQGWRVVGLILAQEVERLRGEHEKSEAAWRELDDERVDFINRIGDTLTQGECESLENAAARVMEDLYTLAEKQIRLEELALRNSSLLGKAKGHFNLYRLFSCVGSDSYDPECAELNIDAAQNVVNEALKC